MYKVMLIEDSLTILALLEKYIKDMSLRPIPFSDPLIAFEYLNKNPTEIDLIISDIAMPGLSGLEFLEKIRSQRFTKNIPFMFVTVFNQKSIISKAMQFGIIDYIYKPIDRNMFKNKVISLLESISLIKQEARQICQGIYKRGTLNDIINKSLNIETGFILEIFSSDEEIHSVMTFKKGLLKTVKFYISKEEISYSEHEAIEATDRINKGFYILSYC